MNSSDLNLLKFLKEQIAGVKAAPLLNIVGGTAKLSLAVDPDFIIVEAQSFISFLTMA